MKLAHLLPHHAMATMGIDARRADETRRAFAEARADEGALTAHGHGIGSGPDATPYGLTLLLLTAWSGWPRRRAPEFVGKLYVTPVASAEGQGPVAEIVDDDAPLAGLQVRLCGLTGAASFGEAVQRILADPALARRVDRIEVRHAAQDATIYAADGVVSHFVEGNRRGVDQGFRVMSIIGGAALVDLANDLENGGA